MSDASASARTSASDLAALRELNAVRLEQLRARRITRAERRERYRELQESLSLDWVTPYADLLNLARYNGDPLVSGPASSWQRNQGRDWPFYQTEAELSLLRAPARILYGMNGYAQGLVAGLTSYTIGPGCTFRMGKMSDRIKVDQSIIDAAQRVVDELLERNSWKGGAEESLEVEFFVNSLVDGEGILAHYFGDDGWTDYRCRDAQQLTMPPTADFYEYGFGVCTPKWDSAKHLKYWLQYGDTPSEGQEYEPDEITHFKRNVLRSMKRGIPDFSFDIYDALYLCGKLRTNLGETAAQQASIVGVRQHKNAAEEDVQAFNDADADFTKSDPITQVQQNIKLRKRGGWEDIPDGLDYVPGPIATSSPIHIQVLDACARSGGQKWQAPAWLMSGDLNAMNYATSLTAESPFVKEILRQQGRYCEVFRRAIWLGFRHYVRTRGLRVQQVNGEIKTLQWDEIAAKLKLSVTAPSPETRNKLEEAQRAQTEITLGVQSRQAYMQEQGRDPDKIEADNQEYQDKFGKTGGDLPLDAGDEQQQVQTPAPTPGDGSEVPTVESEHISEGVFRWLLESERELLETDAGGLVPKKVTVHPAQGKPYERTVMTKPAEVKAGKKPKQVKASEVSAAKKAWEQAATRSAHPDKDAAVLRARERYDDIRKQFETQNKPQEKPSEESQTNAEYDTARKTLADSLGYSADDKLTPMYVLDTIQHRARGDELPFEFGRLAYALASADETQRLNGEAANLFRGLNPDQVQHVVATLVARGIDGNQSDVATFLNSNIGVLRGEHALESLLDDVDDVHIELHEADAPPGKVWKEITVTRGGKQFKQKRLVNAEQTKPKGKPAAKKEEPKPAAKPDPKQTADAIKAQLAGDAAKLTPKAVKDLSAKLATLTVPQIKAIKSEHDIRGGKSKADHIASLVAKAKELKKAADAKKKVEKKAGAAKPEAKPTEKPAEAKPTTAPDVQAPAPEVKPAEAPKPAATSEPHPVAKKLILALNAAPGLSDDQREHYGRAVARVVRSMPKVALDRMHANLDEMNFLPSTKDVAGAMIEQMANQPGLDPEQRDNIRTQYAYLKDKNIGGVYMNGFKTVHADGDSSKPDTKGRHGKDFSAAHGIYGHEWAHVVDGPTREISHSPDWKEAFGKEIVFSPGAEPPLTKYAGEDVGKPQEGFAEFGRLVYASDVPHAQIAREFPQCTAIWKQRGLWPTTERGGTETKMPEVFSERVDIGKDGTHADVLLKKGGAS